MIIINQRGTRGIVTGERFYGVQTDRGNFYALSLDGLHIGIYRHLIIGWLWLPFIEVY